MKLWGLGGSGGRGEGFELGGDGLGGDIRNLPLFGNQTHSGEIKVLV